MNTLLPLHLAANKKSHILGKMRSSDSQIVCRVRGIVKGTIPPRTSLNDKQSPQDLAPAPPFIWPEARAISGLCRYQQPPPFGESLLPADLISALLVGIDDGAIRLLKELVSRPESGRIFVIAGVSPAGPTRAEHLRALKLLIGSCEGTPQHLDVRVLPIGRQYGHNCERSILPPTTIQACDTSRGRTIMCVGSTGDAGHDPTGIASLNFVFQPEDALRDEWRRWFQFVFESAAPLNEASIEIPCLVPAAGSPDAADAWAEYTRRCNPGLGATIAPPMVDAKTGEVIATADGRPVTSWDGGTTALDPLAQVFQQVYSDGWLVTVEQATRIKPLAVPVRATLLGQQSARTVGAVTQKQSFSLRVLDDAADKAMEKFRKITDLIDLLTLPLSNGNRWLPETARGLLEKAVEERNAAGRAVLVKALGGDSIDKIPEFLARRRDELWKNLNEMYRELKQGDHVPADTFDAVLREVEDRLKAALTTRVAPRLVLNRIAAPQLAGNAPDENWSQPLSMLSCAAVTLRESFTDPYFVRRFSGLSFGEGEFRNACDPFNDHAASSQGGQQLKAELEFIEQLLEKQLPTKFKCQQLWHLIQGMPHFYFTTRFRCDEPETDWPESFVIITAYAETGRTWTDQQNSSSDAGLEQELISRGCLPHRVTGFSPETGHAEPGWSVALNWHDGCELGRKFQQDAIYVVQGDNLFVTYCDERRALVPIGQFRERLAPSIDQ